METSINDYLHKLKDSCLRLSIYYNQRKTAKYWSSVINKYFNNSLELPKYELKALKPYLFGRKIIWQYWGQGFDSKDLPEVVKLSVATVDKYKGDCLVIRLDDNNIKEYVELPDFIYDKVKSNSNFKKAFFSDLLRISLVYLYGGLWLDATILLTNNIPDRYFEYDFFMFQRDNLPKKELWMKFSYVYWGTEYVRVLNSIIFGRRNSEQLKVMIDLLMYYWYTMDKILNYFFFQIMFYELISKRKIENCTVESDHTSHMLQLYINSEENLYINKSDNYWINLESIFSNYFIHKLTYFEDSRLDNLKDILKRYDIL